jgi:hypothetical protein
MTTIFSKDPDDAIDAAILSGMMAVGGHPTNDDQRRTYARALIAELLRGMEPPEWFTTDEDCGFNAAITEIRRRAGLEVES